MSPIGKSPVEHASDEIFVYCLIVEKETFCIQVVKVEEKVQIVLKVQSVQMFAELCRFLNYKTIIFYCHFL